MTTKRMDNLSEINVEISQAEQDQDFEFFQKLLSERMIFRRANGTISNKNQFLENLHKPSPFISRESEVVDISFDEAKQNATCVVIVKTISESEVKSFQNIRFFYLEGNHWQLYAWFNQGIKP